MKKILSIDGGGIRGIIPAMVLEKIEEKTKQDIAEIFDLIVGTSTGGLLALGLGKDGDEEKKGPYKAADLVKIYKEHGNDIFGSHLRRETSNRGALILEAEDIISSWKKNVFVKVIPCLKKRVAKIDRLVSAVSGLEAPLYFHETEEKGIVKVLKNYFGEATLENVRPCTKVMVTCYDIHKPGPFFLKSWCSEHQSVRIRDAARATSAAPTYFEPIELTVEGEKRALIDGGVFINSPAVSAYAEAKKAFPDEELLVLSLGTGIYTKRFEYEDAKDWGKVRWFRPLLDCIFDGMQDATNEQMKMFLGDENYFHLTDELSKDNEELDNVDPQNIKSLKKVAKGIIASDDFKKFLERLEPLIKKSDSSATSA